MSFGWESRPFGATGLRVSPLGIGAFYGLEARDVERAFERGVNYLYWGMAPRPAFGAGVRAVAQKHREKLVLMTQQYGRFAWLIRPVLEFQLRRLRTDYV